MTWRSFADDPALGAFAPLTVAGWRLLVRRGFEAWAEAVVRGEVAADRTVAGGRAPHPVLPLPDAGEAVLRRYLRGGMMRHLNHDRYLLGHRSFEELAVWEHARMAGVRTPEVIAAAERPGPGGLGYRAMLASRLLPDAEGLDVLLRTGGETARTALIGAGEQVGHMHRAGIAHPDLNLRNLLVRPAAPGQSLTVHLIDFDRARLTAGLPPAGRRRAEFLRLARSARKLGTPLDPAAWAALREGYGSDWPVVDPPPG